MAIKYAQLINSFVSTEGGGGIMTNYVYYTFLVFNTDGTVCITEGKYREIAHLLPYIRTPLDDIAELKETIKNLRKEISNITENNMNYLVNSLFPIPDILNKNEVEAVDMLEKAGLQPVLVYQYPQSTPRNGKVRAFARNSENFKMVDLKIVHDVPEINGRKVEDAQELLTEAGFRAEITNKAVEGKESGIVLEYIRENENDLCVTLVVSTSIPEITGLTESEATKLLEEAGYTVVIQEILRTKTPGLVEGWKSVDQNTIQIAVSRVEKETAKRVVVKGTALKDSTEDSYNATAEFDKKRQTLNINLMFISCTKIKHQIIGVDIQENGLIKKSNIPLYAEMEPNVRGSVKISIPLGNQFEPWLTGANASGTAPFSASSEKMMQGLPEKLNVTLLTQYGVVKKKESVDLQFTFEW